MAHRLRAMQADITTLGVDAIVNAALPLHPEIHEVVFCCFTATDLAVYESLLD